MLTLQSLLAHSRKSKPSQEEAHWSQRWPVNGPWVFLELSPGCGYRKARCSIYSSDSSVPFLAALLTGPGWLPSHLPILPTGARKSPPSPGTSCLAIFLTLFASHLGYYAWKWLPDGRLEIFCFPCRSILHHSPLSAMFQEAKPAQLHQQLDSANGGYQQEIRRLQTIIGLSSLQVPSLPVQHRWLYPSFKYPFHIATIPDFWRPLPPFAPQARYGACPEAQHHHLLFSRIMYFWTFCLLNFPQLPNLSVHSFIHKAKNIDGNDDKRYMHGTETWPKYHHLFVCVCLKIMSVFIFSFK